MSIEPLAVSLPDAAAMLGVSRRSVQRHVSAGTIRARRFGSRTIIEVESLKKYLASLPPVDGPRKLEFPARPKAKKCKTRH